MKKLIIGLFMISAAFTFAACNSSDVEESVEFETEDQVFAIEALSAASLLDYSNITTLNYVPLSVDTTTTEETVDVVSDEIDEVDRYLSMMENFLGDNNALSVETLVSDREEWENLVSFTTVDILGEEVVYYMYYNETLFVSEDVDDTVTTTEVPTTEAPETTEATTVAYTETLSGDLDQERNFYFEDEDDNEVAYLLTGIIIAGELEYSVEGKRVIEENGDEVFRLRSFLDKDNFVKVAYKLDAEDNTRKFFFEVVTDGVLVSSSDVKIFEEDGELKVLLNLAQNGDVSRYIFKVIEEEDATYIHIKYDIRLADGSRETGNIHIVATIDELTGETIYTYKVLQGEQKVNNRYVYRYEKEKRHENRTHRENHNNEEETV